MLIFITFLWLLSLSQSNAAVAHPSLGPVYGVTGNDSLLNFTFVYPPNYQFVNLYVRFNIYDFIDDDETNPQIYPFQWSNFTNSNTSLPWVIPTISLIGGDYIIGCFEWVQTDINNTMLDDTQECVLTRASINSTRPAIEKMNITIPVVANNTIAVYVYNPDSLPYDVVNITSNLNGAITPSTTNTNSNTTTMNMPMYTYTNLSPNTRYNVCVYAQYANSKINATYRLDTQCQSITTSAAYRIYETISNMMMIIMSIMIATFI